MLLVLVSCKHSSAALLSVCCSAFGSAFDFFTVPAAKQSPPEAVAMAFRFSAQPLHDFLDTKEAMDGHRTVTNSDMVAAKSVFSNAFR